MKLKKYDTEMFNLKENSGLPSYFLFDPYR